MQPVDRRQFLCTCIAGLSAVAFESVAADAGSVAETDPTAVALGYRQNTTKVDPAKYPQHANSQTCASCQLFQGKPTDAAGACALFAGKQVAAAGWCSAWAKRT